jgi:hypothetical protein
LDLVKRLLDLAPDTTKVHNWGVPPLHIAILFRASSDVITMLFEAHPKAAEIKNKRGELPFKIARSHNASDHVINMLFEAQRKLTTTPSIIKKLDPYQPNHL